MTGPRPRAVWVSTSLTTRGGIATFVRQMRGTDLWNDWNIRHIATHRDGSVAARVWIFLTGIARLVAECVRQRPDLAHIHTSSHGSFMRKCTIVWLCKAFRVPVVLHVHGSRFHDFHQRMPRAGRWLIRTTLEHSDVVIALGDVWAERLRTIAPDARIVTVPNAIRPGRPVDQHGAGRVGVVFLGQIGFRKGTFALLDAWALLQDRGPVPARLTVAGDGDVTGARTRSRQLGIGDSVTITGWLAAPEVSQLLDDSHILVLPSRDEGQPMAVLEAMARGLCVVASDAGGIPEILGGAGITVGPEDTEALAQALAGLIADPEIRTGLGARALARIRSEYDLAVVSQRFDAIYSALTTRVPARRS